MKIEKVLKLQNELMPFVTLVLAYEDSNNTCPLENDYFRLDREDIDDRDRFEKVIYYLAYLSDVMKNARMRYSEGIDLKKWNELKKKLIDNKWVRT